ncbi:MAG: hypothetical protein D6732_02220 [Methanobacteriota archaeon]|nr:MAG: hypothetical protein D6732_02220 [Euryarchaeota archaeon]
MGWTIQCNSNDCSTQSWAANIVTLIENHTDTTGWFVCKQCGGSAFIKKSFHLQEKGHTWEPYLRGVIRLGAHGDTYQPFIFLVSYEPAGKISDIWFSYYKDLRRKGGSLKLGHGPGGPPVLGMGQLLSLLSILRDLGLIVKEDIHKQKNQIS